MAASALRFLVSPASAARPASAAQGAVCPVSKKRKGAKRVKLIRR
jgi:hypothetical protein